MASMQEIMQLCRLCLVKDQVNTPIFEEVDDISQIFLKISACLPVKVTREDKLPKRICDSCSYKLELFYDFWNTSVNSEKQLTTWLTQLGADKPSLSKVINTFTSHDVNPIILKQELPELLEVPSVDELSPSEDLNISETQDYVLQQQQLPYEGVEFEFQQEGFLDGHTSTNVLTSSATVASEITVVGPRRKRQATNKVESSDFESEDDDLDSPGSKIAKIEDEGINDATKPFINLPSTSNENDEPGPSGVGKAATDAPFHTLTATIRDDVHQAPHTCEVCTESFTSKNDYLTHHMNHFGQTFTCCRCNIQYKTATALYSHYDLHKLNPIIIDDDSTEFDYTDVETVEAVISIPNDTDNDNEDNDMLYVLDGSQCVNEIVIEDENEVQNIESPETFEPENIRIVHVEHGYMLPSIFKGQLETKRRYTRKESITEIFSDTKSESDIVEISQPVSVKSLYQNTPKARPKRRHEVPDFSATNYILLNPNDDVDMMHFKCLRCEQLFISKFTFFRHIEKGKCFINSCDVCSASFNKNSEFYEHYLAEHTDRAICNFCFRTFMYEKNVKEHMLRHLDQFRHRCEECNKGFYTVREYRNHYKNRHMGIRHKCEICGRSFADEYYFKRHVATHEKAVKK